MKREVWKRYKGVNRLELLANQKSAEGLIIKPALLTQAPLKIELSNVN